MPPNRSKENFYINPRAMRRHRQRRSLKLFNEGYSTSSRSFGRSFLDCQVTLIITLKLCTRHYSGRVH